MSSISKLRPFARVEGVGHVRVIKATPVDEELVRITYVGPYKKRGVRVISRLDFRTMEEVLAEKLTGEIVDIRDTL